MLLGLGLLLPGGHLPLVLLLLCLGCRLFICKDFRIPFDGEILMVALGAVFQAVFRIEFDAVIVG